MAPSKGEALPPAVADRIDALDRLGPERFAAARAPGLLADPAARPDVLRTVEHAMAAIRRPGYDQAARLLAGGRLLDDAAKVDVPTAVLVGAQDRITPPANVRRVFEALRGPSQRAGLSRDRRCRPRGLPGAAGGGRARHFRNRREPGERPCVTR